MYEPLPEMDRKNIKGSNSAGMPRRLNSGDNKSFIKFMRFEAVKQFTAKKIPIIKGRISKAVFRPDLAPSMK